MTYLQIILKFKVIKRLTDDQFVTFKCNITG